MALRPNGPRPALIALAASALFLYLALLLVADANAYASWEGEDGLDEGALQWGGAAFLASMASLVVAVTLWLVQPDRHIHAPEDAGALAPAIGMVGMAHAFVERLYNVMVATGIMVISGGIGLLAAASLWADGTPYGPFASAPRLRTGGVPWNFDNWQVDVTTLSLVIVGVMVWFWAAEFRHVRRLRKAWTEAAPEV